MSDSWTSPVHSTSYEPPTVAVVPRAELDKLRNELTAANLTIKSLTNLIEQAEALVEERDQRNVDLAADLLEERSQCRHFAEQLDMANAEVAELRDQLAQAKATIVRLTQEIVNG